MVACSGHDAEFHFNDLRDTASSASLLQREHYCFGIALGGHEAALDLLTLQTVQKRMTVPICTQWHLKAKQIEECSLKIAFPVAEHRNLQLARSTDNTTALELLWMQMTRGFILSLHGRFSNTGG